MAKMSPAKVPVEKEKQKTLLEQSQDDMKYVVDQYLKPKIDQLKSIQQNEIVYKDRYGLVEGDDGQLISRSMVGSRELIEDALFQQEQKQIQYENELAEVQKQIADAVRVNQDNNSGPK